MNLYESIAFDEERSMLVCVAQGDAQQRDRSWVCALIPRDRNYTYLGTWCRENATHEEVSEFLQELVPWLRANMFLGPFGLSLNGLYFTTGWSTGELVFLGH